MLLCREWINESYPLLYMYRFNRLGIVSQDIQFNFKVQNHSCTLHKNEHTQDTVLFTRHLHSFQLELVGTHRMS